MRSVFSAMFLFAIMMMVFASAAFAGSDGWYMGAETGFSFLPQEKFVNGSKSWSEATVPGFGLYGQSGYAIGPYRLEGEIGWRNNDIKSFNINGGSPKAFGTIQPLGFLLNGYYDFTNNSAWTPYLGAGAGGALVNANNVGYGGKIYINSDEFVPAYQGIAGVSYQVGNNLSLKADYRYFRTASASFNDLGSGIGGSASSNYASHSVQVGFTYRFGSSSSVPPEPSKVMTSSPLNEEMHPPAMASQLPPAAKFTVFFDFDKALITEEGKKTIASAAKTAKDNKSVMIHLTGNSDSTGTVPYNKKLSLRRADAVKASLVKLGIPASEISVVGKGKSELPVPTKDGVREPLNRRVLIQLQ